MDRNTKMHAEYCVQFRRSDGEERQPYQPFQNASKDDAKVLLQEAEMLYPSRYGYKHRIAVRLVGDWCEMKENGK